MHSKLRSRSAVLVALLLVGVLMAACGSSTRSSTTATTSNSSSSGSPTRGGSLTIALEANWAAIDPLKGTALDDGSVFSAVYDSLFSLSSTGAADPDLATSYAVSNGGLTYTIQLRHGVEFQDGTPFNAAAAVVNLERVLNPANACACLASLAPIQSVAADGGYAITVQLKVPYAPLPTVLASFPGMMASPAAIQKYGSQLGFHPVGTGPFVFQSMVMDSSVHFARWVHYWKSGKPYLDSLTFLAGSTSPSEYAAVREGTIQVDNLVATQEYEQAVKNSSVHVVVTPAWGTTFIMMASDRPPFNNRLARLAVSYATDQAALQKAFGIPGLSAPTESPLPPASWAYPGKNVPGYPGYDLAKAKALVKQLGGLTFSLSIASTADMSLYDAIQAEWKAAGMNVSIVSYDQVTLISRALSSNFQAMYFRWQGSPDPDGNLFQFLHGGASANFTRVSDPQLDSLLTQGRTTSSQAARTTIYHQIAARLAYLDVYTNYGTIDWLSIQAPTVHGVVTLPNDWLELGSAWVS